MVAVVGPNGAGKTTILKAVGGLLRPVTGKIIVAGEDIAGLPVWEVVRRGVVYVPEGTNVFPEMSVLENLEIGGYLNRSQDSRAPAVCLSIVSGAVSKAKQPGRQSQRRSTAHGGFGPGSDGRGEYSPAGRSFLGSEPQVC